MKGARHAATASLSFALLLFAFLSQPAYATTFVGGTADWTFAGPPAGASIGVAQAAEATFQNHLNASVLGVVLLVLRNNLGQCVYYTTSTISLTEDEYGTVYLAVSGVSPGIYSASVFAMSTGGVAISNSSTISFSAG